MKKHVGIFMLALSLILVSAYGIEAQPGAGKPAGSGNDCRIMATNGNLDRFLGNDNLGDYWDRQLGVVISSNHKTWLNFSLQSFNYGRTDVSSVSANARVSALGIMIPVGSKFSIKTVYDAWVELGTKKTIDAGGVYLNWNPNDCWWSEFAIEQFLDKAPELYNLTAEYAMFKDTLVIGHLYSGFSHQYVQEDNVPRHYEERIMLGSVFNVGSWRIGWGASSRFDSQFWGKDSRAWNFSVALPVSYSDTRPWAPGLYVNYREKPGSRYLMALGSFGGYALNPHMITALIRSNYRALNTPTRVVNNQNFNIAVLNSNPQEFGRISWSIVSFSFDPTDDLTSTSTEGSLFYTHTPWHSGTFAHPFIGYTYGDSEDITYNVGRHRLESIGHARHSIDVGGRFRYRHVPGTDPEKGYLRIDVTTHFGSGGYEGSAVELTTWF